MISEKSPNDQPARHIPSRSWLKWGIAILILAVLGWFIFKVSGTLSQTLANLSGKTHTASGSRVGAQATVRYAQRFSLEYRNDCKIIRINQPWRNAKSGFVYQLVPRGTRPKSLEPGSILVETPVRRVILLASVHLPSFVTLDRVESVVGVAGARHVSTPLFVTRLADNQVVDVADSVVGLQKQLNYDRLFSLKPDLIFLTGKGDPKLDHHEKLAECGFKVALCAESMENEPLGRAEWIKFVAAFLDQDGVAETHFKALEDRYNAQKALAQRATRRPTVICGIDSRGAWQAPGGGSYVAAYFRDAGADYLLGDNAQPGNRPYTLEAVLEKGRNADFWMLHMGGSHLNSLQELLGVDPRYALFQAYRNDRVYSSNPHLDRITPNDYWEGGAANPDLVLADLISIFHPDLLPKHTLRWHARLPKEAR